MGKISQKSQKIEFEQGDTNICHMEYQDINFKIHMSQLDQLEGTQSALLWLVLNNAFCTISANMSTKGMIPIWASWVSSDKIKVYLTSSLSQTKCLKLN